MESTILVIENNKEEAEFVSDLLRLEGYHVCSVLTGKSGLELVYQLKPNLILCALMVPEVDGFGVLHVLNKNPATAEIPFILLADKIDKDDFRKGMNLGADDFIIKPFDCNDLLNAIDIRLKKYDRMRNHFDGYRSNFQDKAENAPIELIDLVESSSRRTYKKRDYLFSSGEPQHYLYYIVKGEVKASNTDENGKEMICRLIGSEQFAGYKSLIIGSVHTEDAVVLAPTEVSLIKGNDFLQLIYCNRRVAKWLIDNLAYDFIQTEKRLLHLAYQSVREKVAAALLQIYERQDFICNERLFISLSRKNLAAIVGTALESLNRTILDFRKEGIVEITPTGIHILELNKLEGIVHPHPQITKMINV